MEAYLSQHINKSESIEALLREIILVTNSNAGSIFIFDGDTHTCLECFPQDLSAFYDDDGPSKIELNKTYFSQESTGYTISIPIYICNNYLGFLWLWNETTEYNYDVSPELTPWLSLLQIILNKERTIIEYTNSTQQQNSNLFLANMSHEIRTPANGIIGYGQLLLQTNLTHEQKAFLNSQNICSLQLMQIINDIIDFSKLSAGKMSVSSECFSIKEISENVRNTLNNRIQEKEQNINFNYEENVPDYLITDKHKIIQLLVNLVSNAHKFSPKYSNIDVFFKSVDNILEVSVKDYGIGISDQDKGKLFCSFEQLDTTTKQGSGLGLAICKKLVELLNGSIKFNSKIGEGSVFTFTIEFEPYMAREEDLIHNQEIMKDKYVLVVDDNTDNRIVLVEHLFDFGMKPIACASPLEALRLVLGDRHIFSLGLIDICMPGLSGSELAKQIKEERPNFPLVALSSLDNFSVTSEFETKLDKPINKLQLFNCIHRIFSTREFSNSNQNNKITKDCKIMVAEDIIYNRTLLENMISSMQFTKINSAINGKVAFDMLNTAVLSGDPYKILLLDLKMPEMDGYSLIKKLKKENITPVIIVLTASTMDEDRQQCELLGIKYFLTKPINLKQLKDVLHKVVMEL